MRAGPGSGVALLLPTVGTCYCPGFQLHPEFYSSSFPKRFGVFHLPEWRARNAFCPVRTSTLALLAVACPVSCSGWVAPGAQHGAVHPQLPLALQCWALLSPSLLGSDLASLKEAELPSEVAAQLQGLSREAEIVSGKARELPQDSPTAGRSLKCLAELSCSQIIQERGREDPEARDLWDHTELHSAALVGAVGAALSNQ